MSDQRDEAEQLDGAALFDAVLERYEDGRVLDAWALGRRAGELESWPTVEPRLLAGRIASHLGGIRFGRLLHLRTYRQNRSDPEAQYYYVLNVMDRRGALAAWEARRALGPLHTDEARLRALHAGQGAVILATLRDFEQANAYLREALALGADTAWHRVEQALVLERQDRYADALGAAREALSASPRYPPAIAACTRYLELTDRPAEAIELLQSKADETQSSLLLAHLITLLTEDRRLAEAEAYLERYAAVTPLKEAAVEHWIANKRSSLAAERGDYALALEHAASIDDPYHRRIAERLRQHVTGATREPSRRTVLDVSFVRQHRHTCAPATLSALSRFWERPADHLSVAEEICYDGTPSHSERRWAEDHGWFAREFRVDWDSTVALIDRGIPFTFTIVDVTFGHLQAVVGYDAPMGIIFLRDSNEPYTLEANARELFEAQASAGPRGMALVPEANQARLADLDLPEASLYDHYHRMLLALDAHDRDAALLHFHALRAAAPDHRLTFIARRALAGYDRDAPETLAALDALLQRYPDDPALQLFRLRYAREQRERPERLAWLRDRVARGNAHPALLLEFAAELGVDDRQTDEALWYARRAERRHPDEPLTVLTLARLHEQGGDRATATSFFRFAACLAETDEGYARTYFDACHTAGDTEGGLAFLTHRAERLGARSSGPITTLFEAFERLDRTEEAFDALTGALERRPEDGYLLLFAATKHAQHGDRVAAERFLEAAHGKVKRTDWLAAAAAQARWRGARDDAIAHWYEIVGSDPLNLEAHGMIAFLLAEVSTRERAIDHLRGVCRDFPHHAGLHRLLYERTEGSPAGERESILRRLLEIDPTDAWAQRELALNLSYQARLDEAASVIEEGLALHAASAAGHTIKGIILQHRGQLQEAAESFRAAVKLEAGVAHAIWGLLGTTGDSASDRLDALSFVAEELLQQPMSGDGILQFREVARSVLTPAELLQKLREAHQRRPDLWQAWTALAQHLFEMGELDEALVIAVSATERFPSVPRCWLELSRLQQSRGDLEAQAASLERCRALSPEWPEPVLEECEALVRQGKHAEAVRLCENAIGRLPLETALRGRLADLHYSAGDLERAIATLREALRLDPSYYPGWDSLVKWSTEQGDAATALALVQSIAASRPNEAWPWVNLAVVQLDAGRRDEGLESLEHAIAIDPRHPDAYDLKAAALAQAGRLGDALRACEPEALADRLPLTLRGRAAWIEAQRGDYRGAIERMERLVEESPDYKWGLLQLVEWYVETEALHDAARAAEQLTWLAPRDPTPLAWLGDVRRRLDDREGATRAFRRTLEVDPANAYAGSQLIELLVGEGNVEDAQRTLDVMKLHMRPEWTLALNVKLEAARSRPEQAIARLRELIAKPLADPSLLQWAAELIVQRGWSRPLARELGLTLQGEGWHPTTPTLWVSVAATHEDYGDYARYQRLASLGDPGKQAIVELLNALGNRLQRAHPFWTRRHIVGRLDDLRRACRGWKEHDDLYFGLVGYVLAAASEYRQLLAWMEGWRSRAHTAPWMLHNLMNALLHEGRDREALDILRHVAGMADEESVPPITALCAALGACLEGDLAAAKHLLERTRAELVDAEGGVLRDFAECALGVLQRSGEEAALTTQEVRRIADARARVADATTRRLVDLVCMRIGRHAKRPTMIIAAWHRLHPTEAFFLWVIGSLAVAQLFSYLGAP